MPTKDDGYRTLRQRNGEAHDCLCDAAAFLERNTRRAFNEFAGIAYRRLPNTHPKMITEKGTGASKP